VHAPGSLYWAAILSAANGTQRQSCNAEEGCYTKSVNDRSGRHIGFLCWGIAFPELAWTEAHCFFPSVKLYGNLNHIWYG